MVKPFREAVVEKNFPITYEGYSIKGTNYQEKLEALVESGIDKYIDGYSIFNNIGGVPILDPFAYGVKVKETGFDADIIANVRMQDHDIVLLQSTLLGGWVHEIKNLLMITGDYTPGSPKLISVTEGLTAVNKYLNQGHKIPSITGKPKKEQNRFLELSDYFGEDREELEVFQDGGTDYFAGAALVPWIRNAVSYTQSKIISGAKFFQTQLVYSAEEIIPFLEESYDAGHRISQPILVSTSPVVSERNMNTIDKIRQLPFKKEVVKRLQKGNFKNESVELAVELYDTLRDWNQANGNHYNLGAHIIAIASQPAAVEIIKQLSDRY